MSTQIEPGDIVQNAVTGSKVIYEVVRIDGDYARVRPLWGASEHTEKVGHLERMCDEQVTGLSQWRANEAYAAMGGVKPSRYDEKVARLAAMYSMGIPSAAQVQTKQAIVVGDVVSCVNFDGLTKQRLAFLRASSTHIVASIDTSGCLRLMGDNHLYAPERFVLVSAVGTINSSGAGASGGGGQGRVITAGQGPMTIHGGGGGGGITIAAPAQPAPAPVPDAKFGIGQVVTWTDGMNPTRATGTVSDRTWERAGWLYTIECIAPSRLVGMQLSAHEDYLQAADDEIEADKHHHHHDGHKHRMGIDKEEIDPAAYREFMKGL